MHRDIGAGRVLGINGSTIKRYTQAIPAFDTVADDDHGCLQSGLAIVQAIPEHLAPKDAADAFGLLQMIAEVPGCKVALWRLLTPEQKQQVTALGQAANGG